MSQWFNDSRGYGIDIPVIVRPGEERVAALMTIRAGSNDTPLMFSTDDGCNYYEAAIVGADNTPKN